MNVLRETHQQWCSLMASKKDMEFCRSHTLPISLSQKYLIEQDTAADIVADHPEAGEDLPIEAEKVHAWHHISQM